MSVELMKREESQMMSSGGESLSPAQVADQMKQIEDTMRMVFRPDVHYGKIPGCGPKPTLLKPGAEKLGLLFRLESGKPEVLVEDLGRDHRSYQVIVTLRHIITGMEHGSGVGICTTKESKYRYRWDDTGKPVPSEYWDHRDPMILGGPSYNAKKKGGKWSIHLKIEIDDPCDYWNTCLKMAKKRALVDAMLNATAASDVFTQDVEDMPHLQPATVVQATVVKAKVVQAPPRAAPAPAPPKPQPARATPIAPDVVEDFVYEEIARAGAEAAKEFDLEEYRLDTPEAVQHQEQPQQQAQEGGSRPGRNISDGQWRRLYAISMGQQDKGVPRGPDEVKEKLVELFNDPNPKHIKMGGEYKAIIEWIETGEEPRLP